MRMSGYKIHNNFSISQLASVGSWRLPFTYKRRVSAQHTLIFFHPCCIMHTGRSSSQRMWQFVLHFILQLFNLSKIREITSFALRLHENQSHKQCFTLQLVFQPVTNWPTELIIYLQTFIFKIDQSQRVRWVA